MHLQTMLNHRKNVAFQETHRLVLPQCCPVSKNPQPGSYITISYQPSDRFLEVYSLHHYIDDFVGGHPSGVRDMEQMIQKIAVDCHEALGVTVKVVANLTLEPNQEMILEIEYPSIK